MRRLDTGHRRTRQIKLGMSVLLTPPENVEIRQRLFENNLKKVMRRNGVVLRFIKNIEKSEILLENRVVFVSICRIT